MSHPAGAIRNYPFYPILPLSSLPFDLPPWRVAGPRDPATTLLFLGWRPGCRGGVVEGCHSAEEEVEVWRKGTSCRVGIPRPRRYGYRRGWFILEGLPPRYSLCKIVKINDKRRASESEKVSAAVAVLLPMLSPRGFPFRDLRCLHRLNV